ncbi:uncharacterized protein [Lepeophtheirus salmonis]|uniref:Hemimethylated DNA-binding domain-containing protein n=2 Tax=Lepeophtheirus salmonis TaxID=72036 RepID=A0A0K2TLW8_LEPSM|nr:F-box only protein 21-like [Lepeophtheirus salmonis]
MPINRDHLGLLVLIVSVPLQYFLVEHMSGTSVPLRRKATIHFAKSLSSLEGIQDTIISLVTPKYFLDLISRTSTVWFNDWESETECPALEVLSFRRSSYIYFGASTVIRSYRPKEVNFRVGQVVKSKFTSYQGVIIGWDETAVAPESWFIHAYPSDKPHWKYQPSYRILVDSSRAITYEPQENLELIQQIKISNSNVWDYFTHFDGSQYLPKPWLKYLYPKD